MSAYGHEMEPEYSTQSLSSGEGSEMGSQLRMESVIYMSSFAATVFIGGLVTVGILLMTLIIALNVMLQSCQSRSTGVVEMLKSTDHHLYDHCKMIALHEELNSFEAYNLPEICKDVAVKYIKEGYYMRDLNTTVSLVENYFNGVIVGGGHDVVLMDIDDFLHSDSSCTNPLLFRFIQYGCHDHIKEAKHLKHMLFLKIYLKLQSAGWPLILLSRKPEKVRDATIENLLAAGCGGWLKLFLRSDEEMKMKTREYFFRRKGVMEAEGYHIRAVISSHIDALMGPFFGTQNFKIPNPLYYTNTEHYSENTKPIL